MSAISAPGEQDYSSSEEDDDEATEELEVRYDVDLALAAAEEQIQEEISFVTRPLARPIITNLFGSRPPVVMPVFTPYNQQAIVLLRKLRDDVVLQRVNALHRLITAQCFMGCPFEAGQRLLDGCDRASSHIMELAGTVRAHLSSDDFDAFMNEGHRIRDNIAFIKELIEAQEAEGRDLVRDTLASLSEHDRRGHEIETELLGLYSN